MPSQIDNGVTLTDLIKKAARAFPSRTAITVSDILSLSYSCLDQIVEKTALFLVASGVKPGDVIALSFPNTVEFVILFLAVIRARAVAAPLNKAYTKDEFEFYLSDSDSKLLVTARDDDYSPAEAAAVKLCIPYATAFLVDEASLQFTPFSFLPTTTINTDVILSGNEYSDVILFLHTSGTTSRPKGVPLTQGNLVASVSNIRSVYRLTEFDSTVIVLPLFHVHGLVAGLLSSLISAASVTLPSSGRFSATTFWSDMKSSNATWYTAVPTIHQIILNRHDTNPEPVYPKLRFIRSCSASLAPAILERLESAFGAPVLEAYAMTEASHLMTTNPLPECGEHKAGSVGMPVGQKLAVLDEDGVVLATGMAGEICVRGPNVTQGYKNNPEANKAAFMFDWFHTGDIGYVDSDGHVHLVGRIKELINRGGEKISPVEVDAVLLSHPEVEQAVTFGVPDVKFGEEVNCAVIRKQGSSLDEEQVLVFCKKNLATFKVPKKVFFTVDLPKTATGKIQRRIVAEHFLSNK
ncbi:4-coumarate--CoA ligase-like 10 [Zostera marina]|uniref:4-coumarate--CoA ligase n=1 Tax=Zostera marina TaxID=29655 RepID=A0A0K9PHD6_ZOSMR|nr:4-coumarate--CoA ligase-like 10 [Zostera marina]